MRGLACYSHVEKSYMSASLHKEGRFGSIKLIYPLQLLIELPVSSQESERSCMCACVGGINFATMVLIGKVEVITSKILQSPS